MIKSHRIINVGIADLKMVCSPHIIRTSGLGSCVGIVIYDVSRSIAGMAHIMLPDSDFAGQKIHNCYKYADTAISILIMRLLEKGAKRIALKAKLAGGADMFPFTCQTESLRIGERNVKATMKRLRSENIPILAKDVGGHSGRTITFYPETGKLHIRTIQEGSRYI